MTAMRYQVNLTEEKPAEPPVVELQLLDSRKKVFKTYKWYYTGGVVICCKYYLENDVAPVNECHGYYVGIGSEEEFIKKDMAVIIRDERLYGKKMISYLVVNTNDIEMFEELEKYVPQLF
ncbi:MAG: hypothetical protein QW707_08330 [Candidatus Bathyarchaeia archaeon]